MAHQLWLLRHGEAEPHDARPDDERRLTARGEDQSRAAGRALAALQLEFQAVFTSPKVRARDTAVLACEALGGEPIVDDVLASGFDARAAHELAAAGDRVLVVGHEPDFSQVVHDLTGARIELKKGGIAGLRLDGPGLLLCLLRPRETDRIGCARGARASASCGTPGSDDCPACALYGKHKRGPAGRSSPYAAWSQKADPRLAKTLASVSLAILTTAPRWSRPTDGRLDR
jgi:phosphohistidine phosphatase